MHGQCLGPDCTIKQQNENLWNSKLFLFLSKLIQTITDICILNLTLQSTELTISLLQA